MECKIWGMVRGLMLDNLPPGREDQQVHLTEQAEMLVAQGTAPYSEIVRQGRAFYVNTTTAVASVVALPTTAVTLALYNNEPDGGRSYIIDQVWALYTVNSAAVVHNGIITNLSQTRCALPANSALLPKKCNGMGPAYDTKAITIVGGTALDAITGLAINWFPLGQSVNAAITSLPGFQQVVNVDGRYIVPPGRYFAVHTLGSVVSTSAQMGIVWHEKVITLG